MTICSWINRLTHIKANKCKISYGLIYSVLYTEIFTLLQIKGNAFASSLALIKVTFEY